MTVEVFTACPACGGTGKVANKRSTPQHKRQFAVFAAAMMHWPESHPFQPRNLEHLRFWLEVQSGHFTVVQTVRVRSVPPSKLTALLTAILSACDRDRDRFFIEADADLIVVKKADSIAYARLPHKRACEVFDEISHVLAAEIGMGAELLLRETKRAA
jgi:hypothetical protein